MKRELRRKLKDIAEAMLMLGVIGAMIFPLLIVIFWPDFCETRPENILCRDLGGSEAYDEEFEPPSIR